MNKCLENDKKRERIVDGKETSCKMRIKNYKYEKLTKENIDINIVNIDIINMNII